jgi:capsid protein
MRIDIGRFFTIRTGADAVDEQLTLEAVAEQPAPQASHGYTAPAYQNIFSISYDGEKNLGELGPVRNYVVDHQILRMRSWQLYLESEICQTVFKRFTRWVIGSGLKLQAEPQADVLKAEKIEMTPEDFNKPVEARFKLYGRMPAVDHSGYRSLHRLASLAKLNAIVGGDVLVILRLAGDVVTVQLVDGAHVGTPMNLKRTPKDFVMENGNRVRGGVELDARGKPVAYHVRKGEAGTEYDRIPARGEKSGALMAFMVYGLDYRLDNVRGLPLISAVMETAKKMERYKEATLGSAEERQKIAYTIEHDSSSTGENPMLRQMTAAAGFVKEGDIPVDEQGKSLAQHVTATTNKQAFNMPIGSKMTALESDNELSFRDFFSVNIELVCATIGIPPEVAMMKYDSNFSASRAALKDWEHTLMVERDRFAEQFYQHIYALWLDTQVLSNKVSAPGYLEALQTQNSMALAAYRNARWVGASVPHIDPLKEVKAEREKLGPAGAHLPMTTLEAATEALNGGDSAANVMQFSRELNAAIGAGIKPVTTPTPNPEGDEREEKK